MAAHASISTFKMSIANAADDGDSEDAIGGRNNDGN